MRFGVVGLGSMGKRRVRDLSALGHETVGFDLRPDRNKEAHQLYSISTVTKFADLLAADPDAIVISTPPDQHLAYYERSFEAGLPFFSEANILTPSAEWFGSRETEHGVRGYPSATMRFYPLLGSLDGELKRIGLDKVCTVHAHYASFLPLWHPWEDYSQFYAGRSRHTCAARETVTFELDWLCWLFGRVRSVSGLRERRAEWSTDIDDTYMLWLEFDSGVTGSLSVEMHQVAPFREARVSGCDRSFVLDMTSHELRRYDRETDCWRITKPPGTRVLGSFHYEQVYREEIRAFADALEGRAEYPKTWTEDRHISDVLYAAEESARRNARVTIADVESAYDGCSWVAGEGSQ
jgi:predicted dehydrogenase